MRKQGTLCKKYSVSNQLTDRLTGEDVLDASKNLSLDFFRNCTVAMNSCLSEERAEVVLTRDFARCKL